MLHLEKMLTFLQIMIKCWLSLLCRDIFCGKLFCHNGNENPNYGQMVRVGDCKAAFFGDFTKDVGQVDDGTKCGDGKVINCVTHCVWWSLHRSHLEIPLLKSHKWMSVELKVFLFFPRCAARISVWLFRQPTGTQTALQNALAMLWVHSLFYLLVDLTWHVKGGSDSLCVPQVCNHRSECQCEPGWLPPDCTSEDEAFKSISTGTYSCYTFSATAHDEY